MVTYTASEIVKSARWFSNTTNSTLSDFYINSMLLSSIYSSLYLDIIGNDNQFVETIETSDTVIDISDVMKVVRISVAGKEITRSTLRSNQTGGYYIENNKLYMPAGNKVIKLCPLPETITCPDVYEEYDESKVPQDWNRKNYDLDFNEVSKVFHGEEIDFDNPPEWMEKDGCGIDVINVYDPYCFVSYSDDTMRLYSARDYYTEWNPFVSKSFDHEYVVMAFTGDITTGQGVIFKDLRTNKCYKGSFVPDTVLSFPNNTLFDLMIKKLAAVLASMVGIENPYLTNVLLPEAETKFYQSISVGSSVRINNVYGRGK